MKLIIDKKINLIFLLIGLLSIAPFISLSFFAQPVTDDFWYASTTIYQGFINAQYQWFNSITGRYFSTLLISVNPLVFQWLYGIKLVPIILLVLFYLCCYLFVHELFTNKTTRIESLGITSLITFILLGNFPDTAFGIYFLTTSITFFLPNILLLAFCYFLLKTYRKKSLFSKIMTVVTAVFIIGGNEHSMLVILLVIAFINIYAYKRTKRFDKFLFSLACIILIFTLFELLAPGNWKRANIYTEYNSKKFIFSISNSILTYFDYLIKWIPSLLVFNFIIIQYFNVSKVVENYFHKQVFSISPFILIISIFTISIGTIFIVYWSVGNCYFPHRSIITTHIFNIFSFIIVTGSLVSKLNPVTLGFLNHDNTRIVFVGILLALLLSPSNRIRIAYGDLIKGRAFQYNQQHNERYQYINTCKLDTCLLDTLKIKPTSIFVTDIADSCNDERNKYWAWYFKKKAIRTVKKKNLHLHL